MTAEDFERLIPRAIEAGTPESLNDALKLCMAYEKAEMTTVYDGEDEDEAEKTELFDQENFNRAHALGRQIRAKANAMTKQGWGREALDVYYQCHLFDAPYVFDSFCIYTEKNRPKDKQFYLPRRRQLLPMAEALQDMEDGKLDMLGISMPPGSGKTTLAEFFLAWQVGKHPELPNLIGSHNNQFLMGMYGEMLRMLDVRGEYLWGDVFPGLKVINTSARSMMIDIGHNKREGKRFMSLEFSSIGSGNAGKVRAMNLLYCDDLVDGIEAAMSKERMDKLWQQYYTDLRQRKVGTKCKELHIATRWSLHDVIGRLEREYEGDPKARFLCFPALDENDESNFDYPYGLGYTTEELHRQRSIMDTASWEALYMNRPIERGGLLFDINELRRYFELPEREPDAILAICDTKEQGNDFCAMPIIYQYGQDFYVDAWICDNGKIEVIEERVANMLVERKVNMCQIESNRGGTLFAQNIEKRVREMNGITKITTKWTQSNKETRIVVNSGYIKERCLFREESAYRNDKDYRTAINMLCSYSMAGKNKHDDVCDVLSLFVDFANRFSYKRAEIFKRPW